MTAPQLKALLRWAIRYVQRENDWHRKRLPCTRAAVTSVQIGKADMWLAKSKRAVAKPKAARKPK